MIIGPQSAKFKMWEILQANDKKKKKQIGRWHLRRESKTDQPYAVIGFWVLSTESM